MQQQGIAVDATGRTVAHSSLGDLRYPIRNGQAYGIESYGLSNTGKGILIGMISAFGSAVFVGVILAIIYFFRYTSRGRILLDRISRPGEFDDEQAFLREEEDALAEMDDMQRAEYLRAKGVIASNNCVFDTR